MTNVKAEDTGTGYRISATLNEGTERERVFEREWSYAPYQKTVIITPVPAEVLAAAAAEFKALAEAEEARVAREMKPVALVGTVLGEG